MFSNHRLVSSKKGQPLGMPALIEYSSLEENVSLCTGLGFNFIELNMNMPYCFPENLPAEKVREAGRSNGIEFTLHAHDEVDLASFHDSVREGHIRRCEQALEWCAESGAKLFNLHINPGVYFTLPDRRVWIFDQYRDLFKETLVESMAYLIDLGKSSGVTVCVENSSNFHLPFISETLDELSKLDGFQITWDTGHDAKVAYAERPVLMRYKDRIAHMHLHDYDGNSDHQVLMTGEIDVPGMLSFARERKARVLIETKTALSLQQSMERLRQAHLI
jgi:sugar phosphate isomerase/epimerase